MKIGIVGNGMIVNMFLQDAAFVEKAEVVSICVRPQSLEKGKTIAEAYQIPCIETDYDSFLQNTEMDAVYVGIANTLHYEYAKKALEAGKHVICEKPFTVNSAEAKELADIAKSKKLFLWEAFIIPYLPSYKVIPEAIGKVGKVRLVQCNYSKISSRYDKYLSGEITPAFNLELAGGALYDLNSYNIHFVAGLFGKPRAAHYYPTKGHNGVDTSGIAVLEYEDFNAVCSAAKDSTSPSGFVIQGEKGTLLGEEPVNTLLKVTFEDKQGKTTLAEFDGQKKLAYELKEFIRQFETKDYDACYKMLEHSVETMEVVDELCVTRP